MVSLLERGRAASATLAGLVAALERSDVIVHIEESWLLGLGHVGATNFVTAAAGHRYLRIRLDPRVHDEAAIAMLGHELQHASEIAGAGWVVDQETLVRLYASIGHPSAAAHDLYAVDTATARNTERVVLKELRAFDARRLSSTD
jgi:hypothetical protein